MKMSHTGQRQLNEQKRLEKNQSVQPPNREKSAQRIETPKYPYHQKFQTYTSLVTNKEQILNVIANRPYVRLWRTNKTKNCSYHKDYGHTTQQCQKLKNEIEFLIKKGYLKEYVRGKRTERRENEARPNDSRATGKHPISGVINTIVSTIEE